VPRCACHGSYHVRARHVTLSHRHIVCTNSVCHVARVIYGWAMSHVGESRDVITSSYCLHAFCVRRCANISHMHTWIVSRSSIISMCHIAHFTYGWVNHVRVSHVTLSHHHIICTNSVCHVTYGWVMSRVGEWRHVIALSYNLHGIPYAPLCLSHMDGLSHMRMSHVTYERVTSHVIESCHFWMSVMLCRIQPNVTRLPHIFVHLFCVLLFMPVHTHSQHDSSKSFFSGRHSHLFVYFVFLLYL